MTEQTNSATTREKPEHYLDITGYVCPMTFVRTKLLLERMKPGEVAEVRLKGEEPKRNVPRAVREQGDEIVALEPADEADTHLLTIRRLEH
ncbi:MAG: sulfurtransferase TusA family protein [Alphaproteobacteria bacterium]